jgi:hypothetical protein
VGFWYKRIRTQSIAVDHLPTTWTTSILNTPVCGYAGAVCDYSVGYIVAGSVVVAALFLIAMMIIRQKR